MESGVVIYGLAVRVRDNLFKDGSVVSEIPQSLECEQRTGKPNLRVAVEVPTVFTADLYSVIAKHPRKCVAHLHLSLIYLAGGVLTPGSARADAIPAGHDRFDLDSRKAKINIRVGFGLIKSPLGYIKSSLVDHRAGDRTSVDECERVRKTVRNNVAHRPSATACVRRCGCIGNKIGRESKSIFIGYIPIYQSIELVSLETAGIE